MAREFAGLTGNELVYDLYTGTGTIANFVARQARQVVGIEYVPEAIEDAKVNSQVNNIQNTKFYAGDMKDILNDEFINTADLTSSSPTHHAPECTQTLLTPYCVPTRSASYT